MASEGRGPSRWAVVFDVFDPTPEQREELFHAAVLFSVEMEQRLGIEIGVTGQPHEELGT